MFSVGLFATFMSLCVVKIEIFLQILHMDDVIKLFWGNLEFTKIKKAIFYLMHKLKHKNLQK